jgi:hypothetical protein
MQRLFNIGKRRPCERVFIFLRKGEIKMNEFLNTREV